VQIPIRFQQPVNIRFYSVFLVLRIPQITRTRSIHFMVYVFMSTSAAALTEYLVSHLASEWRTRMQLDDRSYVYAVKYSQREKVDGLLSTCQSLKAGIFIMRLNNAET